MKSIVEIITEEVQDYRGSHQAPEPDGTDSPMHDVINTYGEDIYGPQAMRLYGHRPDDAYSIRLIQTARNKPNMQVKIYRAVPKAITNQEKIKDYRKRKLYVLKTGRLPKDVDNFRDKSEYYDYLSDEIDRLLNEPDNNEKVKINNGDWVTINPMYARTHGQSNVGQFRVLTKTVSAKQLYNEGDVNEWGYWETGINEDISEHNKTIFTDVPQDLYLHFRQRTFGDEANRSHMKVFRAKDQRDFLIRKIINQDIFYVYDFSNLQKPIGIATFDVHNDYFSGYEHRQSIEVNPNYRRIGIATALTDFAEKIYGIPYKPTNLQTPEMQAFTKNRLGENNSSNKKLYYHGRNPGNRPYSGKYVFITNDLGYASGYSDGKILYVFTIPFSEGKIFSIKNNHHEELLRKYTDDQTVDALIRDSGNGQEMDWATLSYISTDEHEDPMDLFEYLGFYGVRLKERQGIDSIYIFDESKLDFKGTIDITTPEMKDKIGKFYRDFAKDKNFLESLNENDNKDNSNVKMGVNINDDVAPFTEYILNGEKTIETRNTPTLRPYVGQRVGIIKTGKKLKATLVGYVTIDKEIVYNSKEDFDKDVDKHLVGGDSPYFFDNIKFGYVLKDPERISPTPITSKGIVSRKL